MATVGNFVWLNLMTTDPERTTGFYAETLGWKIKEDKIGGQTTTTLSVGPETFGGVMTLTSKTPTHGTTPHWLSFIQVTNVDTQTHRATELGGTVIIPPTTLQNFGRYSILTDPQGAKFALFEPTTTTGTGTTTAWTTTTTTTGTPTMGKPCWFELTTTNHDTAFAFYREVAGFVPDQQNDFGEAGTYLTFKTPGPTSNTIGGMWSNTKGNTTPPNWMPYFAVDNLEQTLQRVRNLGGTVLNGPTQVPDGTFVAQCTDPTGTVFGLNQR